MYLVQIQGICYAMELYSIVLIFIFIIDYFFIYFIYFIFCIINSMIIYSSINSIVLGIPSNTIGCVRVKCIFSYLF